MSLLVLLQFLSYQTVLLYYDGLTKKFIAVKIPTKPSLQICEL